MAGGTPPYGYKKAEKKLQIAPEEAEAVKKIFNTYLETGSIFAAKRKADISGFRTKKGERIPKSTIERILTNPVYIGKIPCKGEIFDGIHSPIISESGFYRAGEMRKLKGAIIKETKIDINFPLTDQWNTAPGIFHDTGLCKELELGKTAF